MKAKNSNPSLNELQVLTGQWETEIANASFLSDSSATLRSIASFDWFEDGEFLILYQGTKETAHATWMISRDQDQEKYTVLYFDDRHFSRVYEMSFKNRVWKIWRDAPHFIQSFEGRLSEDGNIITGAWSKSSDGKEWEHDFDLIYRRI